MEYLFKYDYSLYENIQNANTEQYTLIQSENGFNIQFANKVFYPVEIDNFIYSQINNFLVNPPSYSKIPDKGDFILESNQDIHNFYFNYIKKISPYYLENQEFKNYHQNLENFFPTCLLYGIGSGKYIEYLIQQTDIKQLLIIDQNYSLLKLSMHIVDWTKIFKKFTKKNYKISFFIDPNPEIVAKSILNYFFKYYPFLLDFIPYMVHYQTDFFNNINSFLLNNFEIAFIGFGWYDDELIGLKNTIMNIKNKYPIYKTPNNLLKDIKVFIIASGPSIDKDIEFIKKLEKKVIIFSCASAINILEKNNIIPDYHFEMERFSALHEYRKNSISEEYLKKVNLIALNLVPNEITKLFKNTYIVSRNDDCGSSIISNSYPKLNFTNPTVVNMAVDFASNIGFKDIYLFGTDMGFKNQYNHHSKYSAYSIGDNTEGKVFQTWQPVIINKSFEGNFNKKETFFSTDVFISCKLRVENCIVFYNYVQKENINYYNCSDGLHIDHTNPIHSNKIKITNNIDKNYFLELIINCFEKESVDIVQNSYTIFKKEKKLFLQDLEQILNVLSSPITSYSQAYNSFIEISDIISYKNKHPKPYSQFTLPLLRGSFSNFSSYIMTHALAIQDKEKSIVFINQSIEYLIKFIEQIKKEFQNLSF